MSPEPNALRLAKEYRRCLSGALKCPVQVTLYGSRARGDAVQGSDMDLFVILPDMEKSTLDKALDIAWEIGFEAGMVVSIIPATRNEIRRLKSSPFFQAVTRDGVVV